MKKSEPKKEFNKEKRHYPKSVATFPKKYEAKSTSGELFSPLQEIWDTFGAKDELKDVECYKCHKNGTLCNKCPIMKAKDTKWPLKVLKMEESNIKEDHETESILQIRVRFSD